MNKLGQRGIDQIRLEWILDRINARRCIHEFCNGVSVAHNDSANRSLLVKSHRDISVKPNADGAILILRKRFNTTTAAANNAARNKRGGSKQVTRALKTTVRKFDCHSTIRPRRRYDDVHAEPI